MNIKEMDLVTWRYSDTGKEDIPPCYLSPKQYTEQFSQELAQEGAIDIQVHGII